MKFSDSFLGRSLSEKGEPSSKRLTGFVIISFALLMELLTLIINTFRDVDGLGYDVLVTLLLAGLTSLGISEIKNLRSKTDSK